MPSVLNVVTGRTIEEQIRSIDSFLSIAKKKQCVEKAAVAPCVIPISAHAVEPSPSEDMINFLFPVAGKVSSVYSRMKGARTVTIEITLTGETAAKSQKITLGDGLRSDKVSLDILAGDLLTVRLVSASARPDDVGPLELSLSLLLSVDVSKAEAVKLLMSEVVA